MSRANRERPLRGLNLARVLLVDDDPASRLTLQTVLEAGGYRVDSAASAAEAMAKVESREYELVLAGLRIEAPEAGLSVLAHARMMEYKPATALLTTYSPTSLLAGRGAEAGKVLIAPEDLPELLTKVADLISERATRRVQRELRLASVH
jgi:CheY-like chemotaxis protein